MQDRRGNLYIVDIAGTQEQFYRSAVLIDGGMNFGIVTAFAFSYMSPKPWRCTLTKVQNHLFGQFGEYLFKDAFLLQAAKRAFPF